MSDIPAQASNNVDGAAGVADLPPTSIHRFALNTWRIVLGFTFFTHGGQKLFGWFGGTAVGDRISLVGAAGFLEFFGGLAILLGVRTRFVAFVLCGEMAVAYWYRHALSRGPWHWENGGELAAVYCMTFLLMSVLGGGDVSIDGLMKRRSADEAATPLL